MKVDTAHLNGNGSGLEVVDLSDESVLFQASVSAAACESGESDFAISVTLCKYSSAVLM